MDYFTDNICGSAKPLAQGLGLHPGAVTGYLLTQPDNVARMRACLASTDTVTANWPPVIFGVDAGNCGDLEPLSCSQGFISSNASPNAWCAVQAKCEGIPSVIGLHGNFQDTEMAVTQRYLNIDFRNGAFTSVAIPACSIVIQAASGQRIFLREGDLITIDGTTGWVFSGKVDVSVSAIKEVYRILTEVLKESFFRFRPVDAWRMYKDTLAYRCNKKRLAVLVSSAEFADFHRHLRQAREHASLRVMATAHTIEGTLQARLAFTDIFIDADGDIELVPSTDETGVGLLRTERIFRGAGELNALRVLILGEEVVDKVGYDKAYTTVLCHQTEWLSGIFDANSGCPTVVRTLCIPFNKLFAENLNIDELSLKYRFDADLANLTIRNLLHESESFHGCRGMRLHTLRTDLAKLEIEAILVAAANTMAKGGQTDLTILVSMVTFPEEISLYIEMFDEVYDRLLDAHVKLPEVKLAIMVETSAAFHQIEKFVAKKGRHIYFAGALFGGNDFTAATLNLNRHDAVRTVIPHYVELGILQTNPFLSLQTSIVGDAICGGLQRLRKTAGAQSLCIGFGGEQAGDWDTVSWLGREAAPLGLNYVSTSPDRMVEALFAAVISAGESSQ